MDVIDINLNNETKSFPLMLDQIKFKDTDIDFFYTITQSEESRLDLVSFRIYGNTKLWWALATANLIEDLLTQPKAGDILRVPSLTAIERYI